MEREIVLLDTSILIEYFRKTDKSNSRLYNLSEQNKFRFVVSSITKFEIYVGSNDIQKVYWDSIFKSLTVIPFEGKTAMIAVELNSALKLKRKQIAPPDLFIAATAIQEGIKMATNNIRHFERIDKLELI